MCNANDLKAILDRMLEVYKLAYKEKLEEVYLYGSYARGDYKNDSDIDLAAIVQGSREEVQALLEEIWDASGELGLEYDVVISPKVIPYDEFIEYKAVLPYYRNIEKEGVKISA